MTDTIKMLQLDSRLLTSQLDRQGYKSIGLTVSTAESKAQIMEKVENESFDVVCINFDTYESEVADLFNYLLSQANLKNSLFVMTTVQSKQKVNLALKDKIEKVGLTVQQPMPRTLFIEKVRGALELQSRKNNRIFTKTSANVECKDQNLAFRSEILDISKTGLLLQRTCDLKIGQKLELSFKLEETGPKFDIEGEVVRIIEPTSKAVEEASYGIRFHKFKKAKQNTLEKFLDSQSIDDAIYYL